MSQEHIIPARHPTVKDVAERAGVSWTTVSNVVHDHPKVRTATRERVQAAIDDLGYSPSLAGRQLRRGRSDLLALAVPDIESPYFAHIAHAVIVEAAKSGMTVLIDETGGAIARERAVAQGYPGRGVEGIIFSPIGVDLPEIPNLNRDLPMVLLGEHVRDGRIDHVAIDNVASAIEATNHVLTIGRRRIAFMGYQPNGPSGTGDLRLEGYRRSLLAAGIEPDQSLVLETTSYTREDGEAQARALLTRIGQIDAIVCANDLLAIGAMHCFRHNGIFVPQDIALLGWDNMSDGQYSYPSLTTIAPDLPEIARVAVASLLARIEDRSLPSREITVPYRLIVRESTSLG